MDTALAGLRVLDMSNSISGQYCTRLMADYGAEVWLVEPPGGSSTRVLEPFDRKGARPNDSLLFWHLNTGKHSCTLDWREPSGREVFYQLAAKADVLVTGMGVNCREMLERNPQLVACVLSDFGTSGPHAGWHGSEMIFQALSGVMLLNGDADRVPLYGMGYRAFYSCGITAYVAILAALYARRSFGKGQIVDINVLESVVAMNGIAPARYLYNSTYQVRERTPSLVGLLQCSDGWIVLYAARPQDWEGVCHVFGLEVYLGDPRFTSLRERGTHWAEAHALIQAKASSMRSHTIIEIAGRYKLPVSRVMDPKALLENKHLQYRGYWETVDTSEGERTVLGPVFRMSATPRQIEGGAPEPGEHNVLIYHSIGIDDSRQRELKEAGVI